MVDYRAGHQEGLAHENVGSRDRHGYLNIRLFVINDVGIRLAVADVLIFLPKVNYLYSSILIKYINAI